MQVYIPCITTKIEMTISYSLQQIPFIFGGCPQAQRLSRTTLNPTIIEKHYVCLTGFSDAFNTSRLLFALVPPISVLLDRQGPKIGIQNDPNTRPIYLKAFKGPSRT